MDIKMNRWSGAKINKSSILPPTGGTILEHVLANNVGEVEVSSNPVLRDTTNDFLTPGINNGLSLFLYKAV
jgi:hypothetical protein